MFKKITKTQNPPVDKAVLVWDGNCGFCLYWTTRWSKITRGKVNFVPYQSALELFPDIEERHFKEASRLIDTDGRIYSGPQSAYKTLTYGRRWAFLNRWYEEKLWFMKISDRAYNFVAKNRNFLFRISKLCFGSNPQEVRPFWAVYLVIIMYFLYVWFIK